MDVEEQNGQEQKRDFITPAARRNVWIWAIALTILFAAGTVIIAGYLYKNKIDAIERHSDRMNPEIGEGGTKPEPRGPRCSSHRPSRRWSLPDIERRGGRRPRCASVVFGAATPLPARPPQG